jgi:hypothetical protein
MRKIAVPVAALVLLASMVPLHAATLAGVTLPDSTQAGGRTLVLNGLGLRTKFMFKVYVCALYLEQKSSDADAILNGGRTKRIVMHFVRDVSRGQITDAFEEDFNNNAPQAATAMKADVERLLAAMTDVHSGDEIAFTDVAGAGTTLSINGTDKLTIQGPGFARLVFSVWLGPKPPNGSLKKGILGL